MEKEPGRVKKKEKNDSNERLLSALIVRLQFDDFAVLWEAVPVRRKGPDLWFMKRINQYVLLILQMNVRMM